MKFMKISYMEISLHVSKDMHFTQQKLGIKYNLKIQTCIHQTSKFNA